MSEQVINNETLNSNESVVSLNDVILKIQKVNTTDIEWEGLKIQVSSFIPYSLANEIINIVVGKSFDSDTGLYVSDISDIIKRLSIISAYTNIVMPSDFDDMYALAYNSDLFDVVCKNINSDQLDSIFTGISSRVRQISELGVKNMTNVISDRVDDLYDTLNELQEGLSKAMDGINMDAIKGMVDALANGVIDEEKLYKVISENK